MEEELEDWEDDLQYYLDRLQRLQTPEDCGDEDD